jgi:hypothetical protein
MNSLARWRTPALMSFAALALLLSGTAGAEPNRVTFPKELERLTHYTTVKRGNSTEHMLTTREAIDAVRYGKEIPVGTHVVLVDYRDNKVFRYFVMEKGQGWGAEYDERRRTGDWQFQAFKPDRTVNPAENSARCQSCHQSQAGQQFMYTFRDLAGRLPGGDPK